MPDGYGAVFDVRAAPLWLRLLVHTPFIDRFAYPLLVRRGHGYLTRFSGGPSAEPGDITGGWRFGTPDHLRRGASVVLTSDEQLPRARDECSRGGRRR